MDTNYDEMAKLEGLFIGQFDKQVHELGLSKLAPRSGERVLVIRFGTRQSRAAIAEAVGPSGKALGFDLSERAQRGCADTKLLTYEANSLDGIFTSYSLERFDAPPLPTVLDDCHRVLRRGGRIVVIGLSTACEQGPDCDSLSLRRMLTAAGFTIQEAEVRRLWAPVEIVLAVKGSEPATSDRP
jgi:demethylmenaquinone methyltransferase/2-methoxy-6-polyprenyl-1,4-benzoquinol methylase